MGPEGVLDRFNSIHKSLPEENEVTAKLEIIDPRAACRARATVC